MEQLVTACLELGVFDKKFIRSKTKTQNKTMIPARGPQTNFVYHLFVAGRLRAHLSTGASREAPVDNACFSAILGLGTLAEPDDGKS